MTFNKPGLNTVSIGAGTFAYYSYSAQKDKLVVLKSWKNIDFDWGYDAPKALKNISAKKSDEFTVEFNGDLRAPYSENYKFYFFGVGYFSFRLDKCSTSGALTEKISSNGVK